MVDFPYIADGGEPRAGEFAQGTEIQTISNSAEEVDQFEKNDSQCQG